MKAKRAGFTVKLIVAAFIIYALLGLLNHSGRIEAARQELGDVRRLVAEKELANAQLEYEIEHYNDPDVIASIARTRLGLVLPGEIVFYDGANEQGGAD